MGIRFFKFALLFLFTASATFAQSSRTRFGGGITVQTGDVDRSIQNNASTGTVLHRAVCYDTASPPLAIVCPTSTIGGVAGVADDGAGTTGSVQVGMLGQVLAEFDGNATAKNWAINSPTTVGRFHDTGSTTEPTGQQSFYIYTSQSGGAGGTAYIGILNPDVTSGGPAGKGRGTVTITGTPATGNLTKFSGGTSITNGDLSGDCTTSGTLAVGCTPLKTHFFGTTFGDSGGSALTSGSVVTYFYMGKSCTIAAWSMTVDAGTATIDIWKIANGTAIPTVTNTITASALPAISTGTALKSTTLTGWTTSVTQYDIFAFKLNAVSTAKFVSIVLECDQ